MSKETIHSEGFRQSIFHILNSLKVNFIDVKALEEFFSSPESQQEIIEYARNATVSFESLPAAFKEALSLYIQSIKRFVSADIEKRIEQAGLTGPIPSENQENTTLLEKCPAKEIPSQDVLIEVDEDSFSPSVIQTKTPLMKTAFYRLAMRVGRGIKDPDATES